MSLKWHFTLLIWLAVAKVQATPRVDFTNAICETDDPTFADFEYCHIKSVNRTYKYFELHTQLHKLPVVSVMVRTAFLRRYNGYKPFLYNITVDGCQFIKNMKKYKVLHHFYQVYAASTNLNHTCPYTNDVFVDKLDVNTVQDKLLKLLPIPSGDYLFRTDWYMNKVATVTVKLFLAIK